MVKLLRRDVQTLEVLNWEGLHLLHGPPSSCSAKVRLFLRLKGLEWHSHLVGPGGKDPLSPWFLGINPRGLVPVLVDGGDVHIESNDIILHLERKFPEPALVPLGEAASVSELLHHEDDLHLDLRLLTFRFIIPELANRPAEKIDAYRRLGSGTVGGEPDPVKVEQIAFYEKHRAGISDDNVRTAIARFRSTFDAHDTILSRAPFLLGEALSVLDVAWFIYVARLTAAGYPFSKAHPNVAAWFGRLLARPEFAEESAVSTPPAEMYRSLRERDAAEGRTLELLGGF
jgi:glutathione S-transferase